MSANQSTPSEGLLAAARPISATIAAGFLAGLAIGGLGGRVAMLILRLTSDTSLHGLETDDGFTIGVVSTETMFLVIITALLGIVGALVYLAVRSWLPDRIRPWLFGSLTGVVGGALVIRPRGIDFTLLEPLGLAIATFVALPAAYGVATSLLAERFRNPDSGFRGPWITIAGLALLLPLILTGVGLPIVVLLAAALALARWAPGLASVWSSTPVTWIGRAVLAAIGITAAVALARDVTAVL